MDFTDRMDRFVREQAIGVAPAGASHARLYARKFNTSSGSDSYIWWTRPQLEVIGPDATGPGPYQPGPPANTRQLGYSGALDATKGATIGADLAGQFTGANVGTYFAAATIGLAQINTATINNLSAVSATTGTLTIDPTGHIRNGQTAWDTGGNGYWLGNQAVSFRSGSSFLRISGGGGVEMSLPSNKLTLTNILTVSVSGPSSVQGFGTGTGEVALGSATPTASGGTPPYTYRWSVAGVYVDAGGSPDGRNGGGITTAGNTAFLWARGVNNCDVEVTAEVVVTDANGLTAYGGASVRAVFGTGAP
jgi:hypothetical protein